MVEDEPILPLIRAGRRDLCHLAGAYFLRTGAILRFGKEYVEIWKTIGQLRPLVNNIKRTGVGATDIEAYLVARPEYDIVEGREWFRAMITHGVSSRFHRVTEAPVRSRFRSRSILSRPNLIPGVDAR